MKTQESFFRIRAYGMAELALLYSPHLTSQGATRQLRRWIVYNPSLESELARMGYHAGHRCLTPKQVACIVEHLGEP